MKVATFNINSIHARLPFFVKWLERQNPDIVLLQEIKTEYNNFPFLEMSALGYKAFVLGQKGYNGVAVLSRLPIILTHENLPSFEDSEARVLEVIIDQKICVVSVYMPNGNPVGTDKFEYKLKFMDSFYQYASELLKKHQHIILGGDFNVIETEKDVYDIHPFLNNALYQKDVQKSFSALKYLGYYDAFKTLYSKDNGYTFWDYNPMSFVNDLGMRIDYFLLSGAMVDKLKNVYVDKTLRAGEKPSDHAPLIAEFE